MNELDRQSWANASFLSVYTKQLGHILPHTQHNYVNARQPADAGHP